MNLRSRKMRGGFSLIELVIVVVIIGIIGAIAIPRMSRGAEGAADSALTANLAVLRNALDLYATEHTGQFPTLSQLNAGINGNAGVNALLGYSNAVGDSFNATKDTTHIFGPYLRSIPPLPVGSFKGDNGFEDMANIGSQSNGDEGWAYDATSGTVRANLPNTAIDASGKPYNQY